MSIKPGMMLPPPVGGPAVATAGKGVSEAGRNGFQNLLSAASDRRSSVAAAEIARLEMLRSIVSLADENAGEPAEALPGWQLFQSLPGAAGVGQKFDSALPAASENPAFAVRDKVHGPNVQPLDRGLSLYRDAASSQPLERIIARAAHRYSLDPQLIRAVVRAESDFDPRAVSPAGAQGLMQLMPGTAREMGVENAFDPEQNVMGGARYLRQMLDRYQGDVPSALAAYNWGPGNFDRRSGALPRETRQYISRVMDYAKAGT